MKNDTYSLLEGEIGDQLSGTRKMCQNLLSALSEKKIDLKTSKILLSVAREMLNKAYITKLSLYTALGMKKDEIDAIDGQRMSELKSLDDAANKMFAELEPGHYDDHENQTIDQLLH